MFNVSHRNFIYLCIVICINADPYKFVLVKFAEQKLKSKITQQLWFDSHVLAAKQKLAY